jgi:MFS superfamily sulfate permease-like transporter
MRHLACLLELVMQLPLAVAVQGEHLLMVGLEIITQVLVEILVGKDQLLLMVAVAVVLFFLTLLMGVLEGVLVTLVHLLVAQTKGLIQDGVHLEPMVLVVVTAHD